jgi:hypothetical protein
MKRLHALGRLKQGQRNKTEEKYEQHLELMKRAGEILWYKFEGIKIRLADKCFLTPDFAVMTKDGIMELHDTKGSKAIFSDDARVKMKMAAEMYPFRVYAVYPVKGGLWDYEQF